MSRPPFSTAILALLVTGCLARVRLSIGRTDDLRAIPSFLRGDRLVEAIFSSETSCWDAATVIRSAKLKGPRNVAPGSTISAAQVSCIETDYPEFQVPFEIFFLLLIFFN